MLELFGLVLGACVGSFLNVVVYRIPAGLSVVSPPSRCPQCFTQLKAIDNIPIVGWLLIAGRCRYCKTKVSWRYPAIELLTALLFWGTVHYFRLAHPLTVVGYLVFLSFLLALSLIDLDTMTLPDVLTKSGLVTGLVFQVSTAYFLQTNPVLNNSSTLVNSLIFGVAGAVLGIWLLDVVRGMGTWLLGVEAMGAGDPRLLAMIGAWLGWERVLVVVFLGSAIGLLVAGLLGLKQAFPFGPALALGGAITLFVGTALLSIYLNWLGLG